jgi:hypothetical protein
MKRPTYETDGHLEDEEKTIEVIETCWGVIAKKTPKYYKIDYAICDMSNEIVGWIEIRGKTFPRSQYATFYTSLEKYMSICRFQYATGKPAYLVVKWTDGIFIYRVSPRDPSTRKVTIGGRTVVSRGDDQDIEPVIHIPVNEFTPIGSTQL